LLAKCIAASLPRIWYSEALLLDAFAADVLETIETDDSAELWRWVSERTKSDRRTMAFAHNLGYDLRVTGGLQHPPALGLACRRFVLAPTR